MTYEEAFSDGYMAAMEEFSKDAVSNSQMMRNVYLNSNRTSCSSGRRGDIIPSGYRSTDAELTTRIRERFAASRSRNHSDYADIIRGDGRPY